MHVDRIIQLSGLMLQEDGIQDGVAGDVRQGVVQDVPDVLDFVSGTDAARNQLLTFGHLLAELVLQSGDLKHKRKNIT